MAVVPVLNVGVGLLILVILWIAAAAAVIVLALIPKARYGIPGVLVLIVAVTLILMLYPRSSATNQLRDDVDEIFFGRITLLVVMGLFLVGGCGAAVVLQCAETVHAKPLRRTTHSVR